MGARNLIGINFCVFICGFLIYLTVDQFELLNFFGLHYFLSDASLPFQPITYMFVHGGFFHLALNMFALYVFGIPLEKLWGTKRFLLYYFVCGIGASLFYYLIYHSRTTDFPTMVGASGAIFGILTAFAMMFPDEKISVYFLFPIKAKYFVLMYGAIELFSGLANVSGDITAHYTHLGGMATGFIFLKVSSLLRE